LNIVPSILSAIYSAAVHIKQVGPLTADHLFLAVDFGTGSDARKKLSYAFEINWLRQTPDGKIELTESSTQHFAPTKQKVPYVGQKAAPAYRGNVFAGEGLSKKHIPNSRGTRSDIPAWSQRPEGFGFKSISGGEA
jgi:hypothetical protein